MINHDINSNFIDNYNMNLDWLFLDFFGFKAGFMG